MCSRRFRQTHFIYKKKFVARFLHAVLPRARQSMELANLKSWPEFGGTGTAQYVPLDPDPMTAEPHLPPPPSKTPTILVSVALALGAVVTVLILVILLPIWIDQSDTCDSSSVMSTAQIAPNWTIQSDLPPPPFPPPANLTAPGRPLPHIIFFLTDDQDIGLATAIPRTRQWMPVKFNNAFAANPHCCPSRASMLTGRYYHNVRQTHLHSAKQCNTQNSHCGCMRANTDRDFEERVYARYLRQAGYRTVYVGKYLNPPYMGQYCAKKDGETRPTPPHWDEFYASCTFGYYNMSYTHNGTYHKRVKQYNTDYFSGLALDRINDHFLTTPQQPLHLVLGYRAPHSPYSPAPQFSKNHVPDLTLNLTLTNYTNAANCGCFAPQHSPVLRYMPPLSSSERKNVKGVHRKRQLTMESVDQSVDAVVSRLQELGVLDDSLLVFSSDHGYHLNLFNLGIGKTNVYAPDARIPMLMRTPTSWPVPTSNTVSELIGLADLGPTFLQAAQTVPQNVSDARIDGRSVLPLLFGGGSLPWRRAQLVEHENSGQYPVGWKTICQSLRGSLVAWVYRKYATRIVDHPQNTYRAMYTDTGLTYVERVHRLEQFEDDYMALAWNRFAHFELYNNTADPDQLVNLYRQLSYGEREILHQQLDALASCQGPSCP